MKPKPLSLKDKNVFNRFLGKKVHELSTYSFVNIYIWKALFAIFWLIIEDSLCVFFKDNSGTFLYLPPLADKMNPDAMEKCFQIMSSLNKNSDISRIENIEENELAWYQSRGYLCRPKFPEYLYKREDLAGLRGNNFKSQRASYNYFLKNYGYQYQPYSGSDKEGCIELYSAWMKIRASANKDRVYQGMLKESFSSLKILLEVYPSLNLQGRVVKIDEKLKAFTFGFAINKLTFCVLYEVTDLRVKGLSQFIFRQFCRELEDYRFINIMDDSGLENLKKTKLSYRPLRLIPSYIARRERV
jgi:hypothetical protein